jgi:hypothetical protein
MIHTNLIFWFDPTISIVDEIAEEEDTITDIGNNVEPNSTRKESSISPGCWNEIWLDLEEADDTEG